MSTHGEGFLNWIRLQSEYFRHRKTLRLVRRLGEVAALYPIRLWTWAVEQSIGGSLRDIDPEELAMICGFSGDPAELWSTMTECGFIESEAGESRIRSWDEHQGMLAARAERNAERMRGARAKHKDAPDERDETDEEPPAESGPSDFDRFWSAYARKLSKGAARKAFDVAHKAGKLPPIDDLLAKLAALQASQQWTRDGRQYQPYPATWLNREGWHDEVEGIAGDTCPDCSGLGFINVPKGERSANGHTELCKRCETKAKRKAAA